MRSALFLLRDNRRVDEYGQNEVVAVGVWIRSQNVMLSAVATLPAMVKSLA